MEQFCAIACAWATGFAWAEAKPPNFLGQQDGYALFTQRQQDIPAGYLNSIFLHVLDRGASSRHSPILGERVLRWLCSVFAFQWVGNSCVWRLLKIKDTNGSEECLV